MTTNTYTALATNTVTGSSVTDVTFSSIPSGYTDLIVVGSMYSTVNDVGVYAQVNGDTATNYSGTYLLGTGAAAQSARESNVAYLRLAGYNSGIGSTNGVFSPAVISFMNYSNTTTYKSVLTRSFSQRNTGTGDVMANVGMWRSTAAINSVKIYYSSGNIAVGSTFTLYGVAAQVTPGTAKATGGTITYDSYGYVYHTFTSNGTFTPTSALTADILVVGGGGSGGTDSRRGGGGGAGGLLGFTGQSLASGTGYTCTVGAGGAGATYPTANGAGVNSQFGALTAAVAGGRGGADSWGTKVGGSGGSGAGGATILSSTGAAGGAGTSGQGFAGGAGAQGSAGDGAGGGGGAGAAGTNGAGNVAGNGGAGSAAYSAWGATTGTGQNVSGTYYYAGGGGGGYVTAGGGTAGNGGGSAGNSGANATANTGGGSGGCGGPGIVGNGGSGIVIVKYYGL